MFVRFCGVCALSIALLTSCGGEKAENKTEKKEEAKNEAPEKRSEAPEKSESSEKKDLASQLIGKWELVQSFDPSGTEDGTRGTLTFTKTEFTRTTKSKDAPEEQTITGTWRLDASKKDAEEKEAIDCILFKSETFGGNESPENVLPIKDNTLTLTVQHPMPSKTVYKKK
jgi:hypothetical protein